jgi:hypothetical protein
VTGNHDGGFPTGTDLALAPANVDLAADPFSDDLDAELTARSPRRASRTTVALAGLVLVVGGFLGGVLVQKNFGATATGTPTGLQTGPFRGFNPGGLGRANQNGGGSATTGTVKLVDGATLYITTSDGETVVVKTSGTTVVRRQSSAALKDLKVGSTVTVQGSAGSDGVVAATQVTAQQ